MTRSRFLRITREVLLTSTAVLGTLCLLGTLLGFAFGVHPMLFRSGSMAPAISTGDIGFARSVDAADVRAGDIVSVIADSGERVTHRVVGSTGTGSHRLLTLKGDANQVIDAKVYDVASVQRVFFHVPNVGYAVAWLSTPPGVYLVAAYVALLLLLIGRPAASGTSGASGGDRRRTSRFQRPVLTPVGYLAPPIMTATDLDHVLPAQRRRPGFAFAGAGVVGLLVVGTLAWAMPTWAAWTDPVAVTGQSLTTGSWGVPAAPVITACTRNTGTGEITVTWSAVSGATSYNVKLSNPSSTLTNKTSPFTTTTIGKNNSGTVKIVAVNGTGSSPDSVAWTYDGTGANQACHA